MSNYILAAVGGGLLGVSLCEMGYHKAVGHFSGSRIWGSLLGALLGILLSKLMLWMFK